jgi:hypothetical protein
MFETSDVMFETSDVMFETSDMMFETSDVMFETFDVMFAQHFGLRSQSTRMWRPVNWLICYRNLGRTFCLLLQVRRNSLATLKLEASGYSKA